MLLVCRLSLISQCYITTCKGINPFKLIFDVIVLPLFVTVLYNKNIQMAGENRLQLKLCMKKSAMRSVRIHVISSREVAYHQRAAMAG